MDPDELARLVDKMKLSNQNPDEYLKLDEEDIRIGTERMSRCLVAKVLSPRVINREAFRQQMGRILQTERRISIEAAGDNTFVFEFSSHRDRLRTLRDGPWNFAKNLVILTEPSGWQNTRSMKFEEIDIWIQFHNLPLAFMHAKIIRKMGSKIGRVVNIDSGEKGSGMGRFARIRVRINIKNALRQFIRVTAMNEEEDTFIIVVYERLPDFCYACGKFGHTYRECENDDVDKVNHVYGAWFQASSHAGGGSGQKGSEPKQDSVKEVPRTRESSGDVDNRIIIAGKLRNKMVGDIENSNKGGQSRGFMAVEDSDSSHLEEWNVDPGHDNSGLIRTAALELEEDGSNGGGRNTDGDGRSKSKQWKRRAREKGQAKEVGRGPLMGLGSKRAMVEDKGDDLQEEFSLIKKPMKVGMTEEDNLDITAMVAT